MNKRTEARSCTWTLIQHGTNGLVLCFNTQKKHDSDCLCVIKFALAINKKSNEKH